MKFRKQKINRTSFWGKHRNATENIWSFHDEELFTQKNPNIMLNFPVPRDRKLTTLIIPSYWSRTCQAQDSIQGASVQGSNREGNSPPPWFQKLKRGEYFWWNCEKLTPSNGGIGTDFYEPGTDVLPGLVLCCGPASAAPGNPKFSGFKLSLPNFW